MGIYRRLHGIEEIELTSKIFRTVHLHRNNYFYDFPLKVCELVYENILVGDRTGDARFRDFLRDKKMWLLFQEFVRNFYNLELPGFKVTAGGIQWRGRGLSVRAASLLPRMNTDITLDSGDRKIIIDTKFYKQALVTHHGKEMVRPDHLYQLFAYIKNAADHGAPQLYEGMLLYPSVVEDLDLQYEIQGHKVSVRSINLNQNWTKIHQDLLSFIVH